MTSFRLAKVTYSAKEIFHQQIFSVAISYFKANHSKIVLDIYQTAHVMFGDMSQEDHKQHAKYRFASKTLMRILPPDLSKEMEQKEETVGPGAHAMHCRLHHLLEVTQAER